MISVIIPTHNRYEYLINAINSVKNQSYKKIEIIVVDDGSTDQRYRSGFENVKLVHLPISSKKKIGYPCGAVPRNEGMKVAKGDYIAFLDDDDIWMPNKLEVQINEMKKNNVDMSCTDGYIGTGYYDPQSKYKIYNKEHYFKVLKKIYGFKKDFPEKFNLNFIKKHNSIITSSICFKKELYTKIGEMKLIRNGGEKINGKKEWQDWEYWKRMLKYTDCLYIQKPLIYYDLK